MTQLNVLSKYQNMRKDFKYTSLRSPCNCNKVKHLFSFVGAHPTDWAGALAGYKCVLEYKNFPLMIHLLVIYSVLVF